MIAQAYSLSKGPGINSDENRNSSNLSKRNNITRKLSNLSKTQIAG